VKIPENVILVWPGTHAAIPSGYVRETSLDGKHIKVADTAAEPNSSGGSNTHSHASPSHSHVLDAHTHTASLNANTAGGNNTASNNPGAPSTTHGHVSVASGAQASGALSSVTSSYDSVNSEPPYYEVIFIKSDGSRSIPNSTIVLSDQVNLPSGFFRCNGSNGTINLVDKYLKGAGTGANAGGTGGNATHVHVITHTHSETAHTHAQVSSGTYTATVNSESQGGTATSVISHSHPIDLDSTTVGVSGTPNSSAVSNDLAYKKIIPIQNKSGNYRDPKRDMIGLWLGLLADIPRGWELVTTYYDKYLKLTATTADIGNTGGANAHVHSDSHTHVGGSHTHTATVGAVGAAFNTLSSGSQIPKPHSHTANVGSTNADWGSADTTADSSSNEPEYTTVALIKFIRGISTNAFLGLFVDNIK
jgi:hypothetical protein